ncbi:MAG: flavin monoamine oxidase family protein [Xanthobacteraceae bacterium]
MHETDVIVIGAGAAGVAAARTLAPGRLSVAVLEARDRIGGRAWTAHISGLPLDLGCGWLHSADENEWSAIAEKLGLAIDPTPPPWSRRALEAGFPLAEQSDYAAAWARFYGRLAEAAEAKTDRPASDFLEPGCRWNALLNALSSYINGVELDRLSVADFGNYHDSGVNWRVVAGYGRLVETYARGLDVTLECPVTLLDHSGRRVRAVTARGEIIARAAVIAVPPSVLACGALRIEPALPDKLEAAHALPLGLADKLFLRVDEPHDFPAEARLFGATDRVTTGSYHLRPFGRPVIEGYFGGDFAQELENEDAFASFAIEQIAALLGNNMRKRLHPLAASAWRRDPFARGSYSYTKVGHGHARAALAAPVDDRLFFAGEACSLNDFSTAHGAYRTGAKAADDVMRILSGSATERRAGTR